MSLQFARQKLREIVIDQTTGAATSANKLLLNSLFPDEFEYYVMALEVINGEGRAVDRMVLPVLPEYISINKQKIKNIMKTGAGITVFQNNTFEPIPINMTGTFGRRMRLFLGSYETPQDFQGNPKDFEVNVHTGYGAMKMLERLYEKDGQLDDQNVPYRIVFYNLAFNQNYIVEMNSLQFRQDESNNMIWYYTLDMTAVAPADVSDDKFSQAKFASLGVANKLIDELNTDTRALLESNVFKVVNTVI